MLRHFDIGLYECVCTFEENMSIKELSDNLVSILILWSDIAFCLLIILYDLIVNIRFEIHKNTGGFHIFVSSLWLGEHTF